MSSFQASTSGRPVQDGQTLRLTAGRRPLHLPARYLHLIVQIVQHGCRTNRKSSNNFASQRPKLGSLVCRCRQHDHFVDHFVSAHRQRQKQWNVLVRCQGSQSLEPPPRKPGLGELAELDPETKKRAEEFSQLNKQIEVRRAAAQRCQKSSSNAGSILQR